MHYWWLKQYLSLTPTHLWFYCSHGSSDLKPGPELSMLFLVSAELVLAWSGPRDIFPADMSGTNVNIWLSERSQCFGWRSILHLCSINLCSGSELSERSCCPQRSSPPRRCQGSTPEATRPHSRLSCICAWWINLCENYREFSSVFRTSELPVLLRPPGDGSQSSVPLLTGSLVWV